MKIDRTFRDARSPGELAFHRPGELPAAWRSAPFAQVSEMPRPLTRTA